MTRFPKFAIVIVSALLTIGTLHAEPVTLDGITFSDELGGFRIVGGSGRGTLADPFVVVEEITDPAGAILVIRGADAGLGNRIGSHHLIGFALRKRVVNRTAETWADFDLELREDLDAPSDHGDGLSFGQATITGRPFRADRFTDMREIQNPFDAVIFDGGTVPPGAAVTFDLIVTDMTPEPVFHLLQRRNRPVAMSNPPRGLRLTSDDGPDP